MQKNNNILNSIIAGKVALNASVQITDPTAANYIAAGEVVAARLDGTIINTTALANAAASSEFVIVQGQGAGLPLIKSPVIKKTNVTKVVSRIYTAATEQIAYFGYNGTAGNIDATLSTATLPNEYVLRINFREDTKTFGDKMNMIIGDYIAPNGSTNADIAFGLAKNINKSAYGWADIPVKAEVITSSAGATVGAGVTALVATYSKTVTFSGAINGAIVAGSYLVFSGITYQVASVAGTVVTLTMPYQGASAAALTGVNYFNGAPTSAGVKISGLVRRFRAGVWKYYKVRFVLTTKNSGTTTITAAQDANKGIGEGKEIQEIEWETVGNEGAYLRTPAPGSPVPVLRLNSSENSVYSVINIQFYDQNGTGVVAAPVPSYKQLIIAANRDGGSVGTSISDATNGLVATLNTLLGSTIGTTPNTFN